MKHWCYKQIYYHDYTLCNIKGEVRHQDECNTGQKINHEDFKLIDIYHIFKLKNGNLRIELSDKSIIVVKNSKDKSATIDWINKTLCQEENI
ncbi:hypothetical protein KHQ81_00705 [Mycoplasmatota bacterium]|nr:hypothetical protein KHQ81_00705 [Mycoplasmatota bacterium]